MINDKFILYSTFNELLEFYKLVNVKNKYKISLLSTV